MRPNLRLQESNLCVVSPLGDSCRGDSGGGLVRANCGARYRDIVAFIYHSIYSDFMNLLVLSQVVLDATQQLMVNINKLSQGTLGKNACSCLHP